MVFQGIIVPGLAEHQEMGSGQKCTQGGGHRLGHDLVCYSKQHRPYPVGFEEPLNGIKQNYDLIRFVL